MPTSSRRPLCGRIGTLAHTDGLRRASRGDGRMWASAPTGFYDFVNVVMIVELPKRKILRLKEYDYSENGYYFLTVCIAEHKCLLCRIIGNDASVVLTHFGSVCEKFLRSISGIEKYVIMPNHIHLIIRIEEKAENAASASVSQIVKSFKTLVAKEIGSSIFQRSFYDHVIRDENDFLRIWNYIDTNPQRWTEDKYYSE